jgi:Ca2+-binding EF-hand superfamily protein
MAGPSKDKASLDAVQKWFSNALGAQTAKQLARAIDTDKSGYVDVLEYMQFWCVQIGGTNSEKITTFFNLLDADGTYSFKRNNFILAI